MENDYTRGLLANVLRASAPFGTGMAAAPLLGNGGIAGLLAQQSFAQRMRDQPPPQRADTARGMLSADFGQGIRSDDPRLDLAMALATATPRAGIRAYHGSPHDFDRFDMSRIGTGEGAQAYGHGLYFAGNEGVARSYRDMHGGAVRVAQNVDFDPLTLALSQRAMTRTQNDVPEAISLLRREAFRSGGASDHGMSAGLHRFPAGGAAGDSNALLRAAQALERGDYLPPLRGRMYEVNLRTDPSRLLDWDVPLSRQAPPVRDVLGQLGVRLDRAALDRYDDALLSALNAPTGTPPRLPPQPRDPMGADIYRTLPGFPRPEAAAATLRDAGIPGIQYLDQGSRSAGQGTRNYVMFDDSLIEIIRKYGIAGLLGSGAGYGALSPTQEPQNP